MRAERLKALGSDPDAPPFFGRTDRDAAASRELPHRPAARPRRGWRPGRHRLARADRPGVLPRDARRPDGRHGCGAGSASTTGSLTSLRGRAPRPGREPGRWTRTCCARRSSVPASARCATSWRPSSPTRTIWSRADLDTSLCIQGAPGTGKTAVGLHRAAYLLYTYPERLRRSGVLVVGPNRAFLHYIAQVLPSLGEGGDRADHRRPARRHRPEATPRPAELATLKGDARMADVLAARRALARREAGGGHRRGRRHAAVPHRRATICGGTSTTRGRAHVDGLRWSVARERLRAPGGRGRPAPTRGRAAARPRTRRPRRSPARRRCATSSTRSGRRSTPTEPAVAAARRRRLPEAVRADGLTEERAGRAAPAGRTDRRARRDGRRPMRCCSTS